MKSRVCTVILAAGCCLGVWGAAPQLPPEAKNAIGEYLTSVARSEASVGNVRIDSIEESSRRLTLFVSENFAYIPFRKSSVGEIYKGVKALLPPAYGKHTLRIATDGRAIEELVPLALREGGRRQRTSARRGGKPLITPLSSPHTPSHGLVGRHIALWQSHGYYYEKSLDRWEWQRARMFQTVEDLYTQSYVLPHLVPMLENAGANVLLPRERDTSLIEVIVDGDTPHGDSRYVETTGERPWQKGEGSGFAHLRELYRGFENPFEEGTYRTVRTIRGGRESVARWIPDIPAEGCYTVYVSYKTLPDSAEDVLYTVHHAGGETSFRVNQRMGGGTWIRLGEFHFRRGFSEAGCVTLSNLSSRAGRTVTADAVKIGGGVGNISRGEGSQTSGRGRFTEAARYWLQWAGMPPSVYSESGGENDYTDDYRSRGLWVNHIAGGGPSNPKERGLGIPIDMSLAFHTDAGTTPGDSIIGTLAIYHTRTDGGLYPVGGSRWAARDLTDLVQSSIVDDIRALWEPAWTRRAMWNKSYFEARTPRVPATLLELLSHQNFADMRYGLDPRFRFTVSRAIYKGILRFLASRYGQTWTVQPLPVDHLALRFTGPGRVELTWQPVEDPLEPSARATRYMVYTRVGDGAFDGGVVVGTPRFEATQQPDVIYSYKVCALNDGGESFPSEILSAAWASNARGTVLVVNGFDRVSAPADFESGERAGFLDVEDHGVPYIRDIGYIGSMKEFRRSIPWMDDDSSGFGDSNSDWEGKVVAGNTFDYPALHGKSLLAAGYSFTSCSNEVVGDGTFPLADYRAVDLILGKQRRTRVARGLLPPTFETFSKGLQRAITAYLAGGGNIFVSGAFVGSDQWDSPDAADADRDFASEVLKYRWRTGRAAVKGAVKCVASPWKAFEGEYTFHNVLNAESYVVESPDGIVPEGEGAATIMRYGENNIGAGVAYRGDYRSCVMGFPFESVRTAGERHRLMRCMMDFFDERPSEPFRFAIVSDLHITAGSGAAEDLQNAVRQINLTPGIDFTIVAGDLTDGGDEASMRRAKAILDTLRAPWWAIPGNHETTWSPSGMTAFGKIFGGERFSFEHRGILFLGFNTGPFIRMADGHVSPGEIAWLKGELKKVGTQKPVIVITHYPLREGDVDNWYEVTDALRPYNIRLVAGGHYHGYHRLEYDGIPGVLNRSTLRGKEGVGGYGLYDVGRDSIVVWQHDIASEPHRMTALPLTGKIYDAVGAPNKYPDLGVNDLYRGVKSIWKVHTGAGIYSSPAVMGERAFVGDDEGVLTCYRLNDGDKLWSFHSDRRIVGTPAAAEGVVVFGSADGNIYGLDARTGALKWKVAALGPVLGAVTIDRGRAFVGASDHTFRSIDLHSGRVVWQYGGVGGYIVAKPLVTEGKVIFGAWDNALYALDTETGREMWKWSDAPGRMHLSPAQVWPVASHGKVFIADPRRVLTAIDLETGATVWHTSDSQVRETVGLSRDGERIYSKTMRDTVVCYSATAPTPVRVWATNVGFGYEHAPSMPVESEGVVMGGTKNGLMYGLRGRDGHLLWKHKVGNSMVNTLVPTGGGRVLFTTAGGEVGLLETNLNEL